MCGMMLIDMHGVTYANNLLKNPATKRLSGKRFPEKLFRPRDIVLLCTQCGVISIHHFIRRTVGNLQKRRTWTLTAGTKAFLFLFAFPVKEGLQDPDDFSFTLCRSKQAPQNMEAWKMWNGAFRNADKRPLQTNFHIKGSIHVLWCGRQGNSVVWELGDIVSHVFIVPMFNHKHCHISLRLVPSNSVTLFAFQDLLRKLQTFRCDNWNTPTKTEQMLTWSKEQLIREVVAQSLPKRRTSLLSTAPEMPDISLMGVRRSLRTGHGGKSKVPMSIERASLLLGAPQNELSPDKVSLVWAHFRSSFVLADFYPGGNLNCPEPELL